MSEGPPIPAPNRRRRAPLGGFTLVEMLVVVAIVGILAAVAYPSFMDSIRKNRRSDAFAAVSAVQLAQERWRSNRPEYTSDLGSTGLRLPTASPEGYYTVSVASATATGYEVVATAVAGRSQAKDTRCVVMAARMAGGNVTYGSASSGAPAYSAANPCWSR